MLALDQVEHAHDNPLDEITLGECDPTETMMLDEIPAGRKTNVETDDEPGAKSEGENDPQAEAQQTKIKQGKKEKSKGERHANPKVLFYFLVSVVLVQVCELRVHHQTCSF